MLSRRKSSGDHPQVVYGWSPDFLAKSLVIQAIYTKFKLIAHKFNVYLVGITSDLVKKSAGGLQVVSGWSPSGLRKISAGTTLLVHTVHIQAFPISYTALRGWNLFRSCYFNVRGSLQDSMGWNDFRRKHSHSSVCLLLSDL